MASAKQKMTLPAVNLDLTLEAGKRKAVTAAASGKAEAFVVKVDQLRILPGFNVRVRETDDYRQHVEGLKQSIRENGFYPNQTLAGFVGKEGADDVIYVTDGHTRLEAVQEINGEALDPSEEIEGLPVVLKPAESNLADLTIALVQDNSGRPLTPYEMGIVVARLANMKGEGDAPLYSKAEIAKKLSVTERYIDDLNVLVAAPSKVRDAVLRGTVSSTLAIQELRRTKDPKKAEERIVAAVAKATAAGKTKATKKDVGGVKLQTIRHSVSLGEGDSVKSVLAAIAGKVREVTGIAADAEDQSLTTDGQIEIVIKVPAPEKPAAEPKPAKAAKPAAKKAGTTKRTQKVQKPSKANGGEGGAPVEPAPAPAADLDDGEPARLPPAVPTVDDDGGDL